MIETFGFSHEAAVTMPIKRFWFYHRQVDRIRAEKDIRMLHVLAGVTSQEGVTKLQERLSEQVGKLLVYQPIGRSLDINSNDAEAGLNRDQLERLRANIMRHGR